MEAEILRYKNNHSSHNAENVVLWDEYFDKFQGEEGGGV